VLNGQAVCCTRAHRPAAIIYCMQLTIFAKRVIRSAELQLRCGRVESLDPRGGGGGDGGGDCAHLCARILGMERLCSLRCWARSDAMQVVLLVTPTNLHNTCHDRKLKHAS
jgi:hypothetical protein